MQCRWVLCAVRSYRYVQYLGLGKAGRYDAGIIAAGLEADSNHSCLIAWRLLLRWGSRLAVVDFSLPPSGPKG